MEFKKLWACLIVLLLVGCADYQPLEPGVFYKRDMRFNVEGLGEFQGVSVLPKRDSYKFTIEPKEDSPDLLIVRSCHREDSFEKNQKSFLFIPIGKNKYEYTYVPVPGVENGRVCPLRGDAYHEGKNNSQHSWFFIDFLAPDDGYKIMGELTCNGAKEVNQGVAVCQVRKGLVETLQFYEEIRWASPKPSTCNKWVDKGNFRWELTVSSGECIYHAYNQQKDLFRITTIGFAGINLRRGI